LQQLSVQQMTNEKLFEFEGKIFVDANVFGETWAPDESDDETKGSSLLFKAVDMGKPVAFKKPSWANTYTEEDLKLRDHGEVSSGYWWIDLGGKELDTIDDAEEIRDELLKALCGIWDHIKNGGDHGAETLDLDWFGFLPGKRESRRLYVCQRWAGGRNGQRPGDGEEDAAERSARAYPGSTADPTKG
jgi:hypothetical protein